VQSKSERKELFDERNVFSRGQVERRVRDAPLAGD